MESKFIPVRGNPSSPTRKTVLPCKAVFQTIHSHGALVNQLERSATSIGANIREANYAHGKADFIAKLQIALKECYETEYWLELFQRAGIADLNSIDPLRRASGTIRRMRIASVNTAKKNRT